MKFSYPVLAFKQNQRSPVQVAFVAPAADIIHWAGVPRKSDELLTGYQRFIDRERVDQQIVPFFQNPFNSSPTAIIVALRSDSGLGKCVLAQVPQRAGDVIETTLEIEIDDERIASDEIFEYALKYVNQRVAQDSANTEDQEEEEEDEDEDEEAEEEVADEDAEANGADAQTVHLGSETLSRMKELLEDQINWENPNFRAAIQDYVRPAFLIDGQHRATAAARIGMNGLPFMVCGLYNATWDEQVFQFTIVNVKPKRIPPSLIASIAALSLSRREQHNLNGRLSQAGIKMDEVAIMSLVAYDDQSPFAQLIDMGVGAAEQKTGRLGYGGMKRIAKVWYRASRSSLTQMAKVIANSNNPSRSRVLWREKFYWFVAFCDFWKTVRDHYGETLWKKAEGNKLFIGAHLWALQEALLGEADGQLASFWKIDESVTNEEERAILLVGRLKEVTLTYLAYIPREIWTIPWTKESQDTNQGREDLVKLFRELIDEGKKTGKVSARWRSNEWFKK